MSVDKVCAEEDKHDGDVAFIIAHDELIYSGGSDGKIKIWDLDLNLKKDLAIDDAYIYAMAVDRDGRLYTSSWDGTIKFFENPLESKRYSVLLHEREIEALFCDENLIFYCGDAKGGVIGFENGKFMYRRRNIVEAIKLLHVEKSLFYTLTEQDMTIHEMDEETGKFTSKGGLTGKFPVTFFGSKEDGTSKFIAISTYEGVGVTVFKNSVEEKFHRLTIKENLHSFPIVAMKGKGDYLFSSDEGGNIIKCRIICRYEGNEIKEEARFPPLSEIVEGSETEAGSEAVQGNGTGQPTGEGVQEGEKSETGEEGETVEESGNAGSANCIAVANENTIFVGSGDGFVKKIIF